MKENTFDVPAYKFFVLKTNDSRRTHNIDYYNSLISMSTPTPSDITLIPFENVDGLEISEIRDLIGTNEVFVFGSLYYERWNNSNNHIDNIANIKPIYLSKEYLDNRKDKTIDKVCEEYMEDHYVDSSDSTRRMYRCFFERYQDKNYEKTLDRVRNLAFRGIRK